MVKSDDEKEKCQRFHSFLIFLLVIGLIVCSISIFIGSLNSFYNRMGWEVGESILRTFIIGIVVTIPLAMIFEKRSR